MTIDDMINLSPDLTGFSPYGNIPYGEFNTINLIEKKTHSLIIVYKPVSYFKSDGFILVRFISNLKL